MQVQSSQSTPVFPGFIAQISSRKRNTAFGARPFSGMSGACGCSPVSGCGCNEGGSGLAGLGQTSSLDQIIANTFSWLGGTVQANLPVSASVPPQYGSAGAFSTTLQQWLPWIVGGYLVYRLIK
jgi:hypothetical protein